MTKEDEGAATLLRRRAEAPPTGTSTFVVTVVAGADAGQTFTIDGTQPSRVLVGTSPACTIRLTDREVSRRHCAIDATPDGLRVTDLESTNGTFANALRIYDASLGHGDALRVGATTLRVDVAGGPSAKPAAISSAMRFGRVIGGSPEMRRLYSLCERLAASDVPVVIEGETGTGKEVLAESIHEESARASGPFVVFDCTAVPSNLLESALFGHERGAFTGAIAARKGVFEQAHGGTLLIDEIGDLDTLLQSKLLRAIERSEVQRVGGDRFTRVDVRVLAATRRDLDKEVQAGRFRDDLFYRLAVARIELPPLRQRRGDVEILARHFWELLGGRARPMPADLVARLDEYTWPGNVRELHNTIARILALGDLDAAEIGARVGSGGTASGAAPAGEGSGGDVLGEILARDLPYPTARQRVLDAFETAYVERVLAKHHGNVARAAAASGIARRYFYVIKSRQEQRDKG